ncbi:MAG: hypothetical protein JSW73_03965 [Candidatus Woesearchaeota archaeon]|nr:MAG: hypothetical protein JSW73_03965 [Candidatus Woesearchaeota archaeon]
MRPKNKTLNYITIIFLISMSFFLVYKIVDRILVPFIIIAILMFILVLFLVKKDKIIELLSRAKRVSKDEVRKIVENEIIKRGIPLFLVEIDDPVLEKWKNKFYWIVRYTEDNKEFGRVIILSEQGKVLRIGVTRESK